MDEIKRDLRVAVQEADHIVLMGYSLPPDDVDYRAFFAARRRRDPNKQVKCSVVALSEEHRDDWFGPSKCLSALSNLDAGKPPRTTLEAAHDLFGGDNVRFYGGGIPEVFLEGGRVTNAALDRLLTWEGD